MKAKHMKVQLIDLNKELTDAWGYYFVNIPNFSVHNANYFSLKTDILISPANSFGYMDGGIDLHIANYFKTEGIDIQKIVQDNIKKEFGGELLVGQSSLVETTSQTIPFLAVVPTMRIPMPINDSVDVYLAARAIFKELKLIHGNFTVSICGLGTGVGAVNPKTCAYKMYLAYLDHYLKDNYFPSTFLEAAKVH